MNLLALLIVPLLLAQIHPLPKVCEIGYLGRGYVYACTTGETRASSAGPYADEIPVTAAWFKKHCTTKSPDRIPYGTIATCDAYARVDRPAA